MKILVTAFPIDPIGGILNYVELLIKGLKDLNHDVQFRVVPYAGQTKNTTRGKGRVSYHSDEYGIGTGLNSNHQFPWQGAKLMRTHITSEMLEMNEYDLIIHTTARVPIRKETAGRNDLFRLFTTSYKPQIGIVHEPGLPEAYPYIANLRESFSALVCVHEATYNSCKGTGIPIAFIPNPHIISDEEMGSTITHRDFYCFSSHYWKRWKNLNRVMKTMTDLQSMTARCEIAGDGIDMRYATSPDKVQKHLKDEGGLPLYQLAKDAGVAFGPHLPYQEQLRRMQHAMFFLEFGYSKKYNHYGCMFNRTIVEAMKCGAIPVAMKEALDGSEYFTEGENYLGVSFEETTEDYTDMISDQYFAWYKLKEMQERNWRLVKQFDYRKIAQEIIDAGLSEKGCDTYKQDPDLVKQGNEKLKHFGALT